MMPDSELSPDESRVLHILRAFSHGREPPPRLAVLACALSRPGEPQDLAARRIGGAVTSLRLRGMVATPQSEG